MVYYLLNFAGLKEGEKEGGKVDATQRNRVVYSQALLDHSIAT